MIKNHQSIIQRGCCKVELIFSCVLWLRVPFRQSSLLSGVTARCADDACTRGRERGEALRVVHRWLQLTLVSFGGVRDACHAVLRGGVAGSAFLKMPLFLVRLELQNGPRRRWRWTASGRGSQRAKEAFHNHQIHRYCPLLLLKFKRSIARRHCVLEPH